MDEITKRNFTALAEGLKEQREINGNQDQRIALLESALTGMRIALVELHSRYYEVMAKQNGTGPTKR